MYGALFRGDWATRTCWCEALPKPPQVPRGTGYRNRIERVGVLCVTGGTGVAREGRTPQLAVPTAVLTVTSGSSTP